MKVFHLFPSSDVTATLTDASDGESSDYESSCVWKKASKFSSRTSKLTQMRAKLQGRKIKTAKSGRGIQWTCGFLKIFISNCEQSNTKPALFISSLQKESTIISKVRHGNVSVFVVWHWWCDLVWNERFFWIPLFAKFRWGENEKYFVHANIFVTCCPWNVLGVFVGGTPSVH